MESKKLINRFDIKPLTSLRFFAAAGVLYGHFGYAYNTAGLGVSFFFMLSGFILTHSYYNKFKSFDMRSIKYLWVSRAARIYPVHLATLLMAIPLMVKEGGNISLSSFFENAALLQSWYPNKVQAFSYNSVSWTLSNELFFYLSLPFILICLAKFKMQSRTIISILLILICVILTATLMYLFRPIPHSEPYSWRWWLILVSPYINLLTFISGMFLSFVYHRVATSELKISRAKFTVIELLVIAFFVLYFLCTFRSLMFSSVFFMYGLPIAIVILVFSLQKGLVSMALSSKPLVYLGEISFSLYMIHQIVIRVIEDYVGNVVGPGNNYRDVMMQIGTSILIIALSSLTYHLIENPARQSIRRLSYN